MPAVVWVFGASFDVRRPSEFDPCATAIGSVELRKNSREDLVELTY